MQRNDFAVFAFLCVLASLSGSALARPSTGQRMVVVKPATGTATESPGGAVAFFPSEVVTVAATKGTSVLVAGGDDTRPAWLPESALADKSSFRPVASWKGDTKFEIASASGDSGQTYFFGRNGSFHAKFDDNRAPRKWSGKLHRHGQIIGAKPGAGSPGLEQWSVFRQMANGKLCLLNFDTPNGCECVGTADSAAITSCG